jgi:hypothetical protein
LKTTAYFRDVVRDKHPGIEEAWILRVMAEPLEQRRQADGRYALWGLVPEAQNRALRVITLEDRETVHNAFLIGASSEGNPEHRFPSLPRHENPVLP